MFETTDVNRCARAYTCEKFPNFCAAVLQAPKTPQKRYFGRGACYELRAQMAQFWVIEIISGAFAITAPLLILFDFASLLKRI